MCGTEARQRVLKVCSLIARIRGEPRHGHIEESEQSEELLGGKGTVAT
jgi:hypothetical protein